MKNESGFAVIGMMVFMAVAGVAIASGTTDFAGTSLKEKKLVITVKPEMLKTGVADYTVNK